MYRAQKSKEIYRGLKSRFLYENDLNSIYVLLALYDLEENINSISPKYISITDIKLKLKQSLKKDLDKSILHNISVVLHEDINRLELCFYLEGYKDGYNNKRLVNVLEYEIIKKYGIGFTQKRANLKKIIDDENFIEVKDSFTGIMGDNFENQAYMNNLADKFISGIMMNKIINLKQYMSKQLDYNSDVMKFEKELNLYYLNEIEIKSIEKYLREEIKPHLNSLYKESLWAAVNDRVFNRYK